GAQAHAPDDLEPQGGQVHLPTRRKARLDGFDLDAEVCVNAHDRPRLEALGRYVLRPPIALDRLKLLGPDLVAIELERPWPGGATHVSTSVRTFLTRLAALVPGPRANTTLYYGVLASHAKHRRAVLPEPPDRPRAHDATWAALMRHSFGLDVLRCRICRGRMRFTHVVFAPTGVRRLLVHLRCFSDPLPIAPSRGPPDAHDTLDFP
ncbi:MAG TPA: transposase, partial [Sandaracinaceae bacterium LLY-WYZ-13_1]|nr:transposase [Sandaracinaceae bacterium LLY-WYZ-13_1]